MKDYGRIKSSTRPEELEITETSVFVATNIQEYEQEFDGITIHGYEYNYVGYEKDEYLTTVAIANMRAIAELQDQLEAAKILLGVE